jgi:hypothetical protein
MDVTIERIPISISLHTFDYGEWKSQTSLQYKNCIFGVDCINVVLYEYAMLSLPFIWFFYQLQIIAY